MFRDILDQQSLSDSECEMILVLQNTAQISRNQNVMTSILVFGCKFSLISPQILELWLIEGEKQWSSAITARMWNKWAAQQTCVLYSLYFLFWHIYMLYFFEIWIGNVIDTKKQCSTQRLPCWKRRDTSIHNRKGFLVFRSKTFTRWSHS